MEQVKINKADILVIVIIIFIALAIIPFMSNRENGKIAVISQNGKVIEKIDLSKVTDKRRIDIDGKYHNTILVENGKIKVEHSNCPSDSCVYTGWIENAGSSIVCIPNRLEIRIEGNTNVDTVIG